MDSALSARAVVMFAVTNIDDLVILAVFFGQARGSRVGAMRVVLGQYIGFVGTLVVSVLGALGAGLLPEAFIPYLGLLPLALGLHAAWGLWRQRREAEGDQSDDHAGSGVWQVATVTFANGGDNIGVYVPVFAVAGLSGMASYLAIFLIGVGLWCMAGWYFATRPPVARMLSRWGHILLPVVLIGIGLVILIEGGAIGL